MDGDGAWRSLVAHTLGVRVVAGSNPAAPTRGLARTRDGAPRPIATRSAALHIRVVNRDALTYRGAELRGGMQEEVKGDGARSGARRRVCPSVVVSSAQPHPAP